MKVLIVGAGDVGSFLAAQLSSQSEDVIIVDSSEKALERIEDSLDVMTLNGNGAQRKTLIEAGAKNCDLIVSVTSSDETNLVVSALASEMGARRSLARVDSPDFFATRGGIEKNVLGINALICASRLASSELLRLIRQRECQFLENLSSDGVTLALIEVKEDCRFLDRPGVDLDFGKEAQVVGFFREDLFRRAEEMSHLYEGDKILLAGNLHRLPLVLRRISPSFAGRKGVIIGGGDVGFQIAKSLQAVENRLSLIDINRNRCQTLADSLEKVTIIHGDGTNLSLLEEEHVETSDYILSVTKHDEVNLMSSLLGQELGVDKSFTLVHRPGYSHVYDHLGVTGTASTHELFAKVVEKYLPHQVMIGQRPIEQTSYHLAEMQIPVHGTHKTFTEQDIAVPVGSVLVGRTRGEEFELFKEGMEFYSGDNVLVVGKDSEIKTVAHKIGKLK